VCGLREPRIVVGVFVLLFRNLVLLKKLAVSLRAFVEGPGSTLRCFGGWAA